MLRQIARMMRDVKQRSTRRYREVTWRHRALPDFIIIGAQKAGTTSLFHYLSQHPQLLPSFKKEVHYFDGGINPKVDTFAKGSAWYQTNFPLQSAVRPGQRVFEASPMYLFHPLVARRIHDLLPEVKLIALLRNPTDRAISQYFHVQRAGFEPLPTLEALQSEEERLQPVLDAQAYSDERFRVFSYKSRGVYHTQLKNYLQVFPAGQLLLLDSKILFTDPAEALRRVFEFVGVDSEFAVENLNARNVSSNRTEVDPEVYEYLDDYFQPHNRALYDLIGEDYGW